MRRRLADRQTGRQADRQTGRQADRRDPLQVALGPDEDNLRGGEIASLWTPAQFLVPVRADVVEGRPAVEGEHDEENISIWNDNPHE